MVAWRQDGFDAAQDVATRRAIVIDRIAIGTGESEMIELAAAATIAKLASDAVTAIDKMFRGYADFTKRKTPAGNDAPPPDFSYVDRPDAQAFVAASRQTGAVYQTVTYQELAARLSEEDRAYIAALNAAMSSYQRQWNSVYEQRAIAGIGLETAKIDAQLDHLAKQVSDPLIKVIDFVQKMGLGLDDHYHVARQIAREYLA